MGIILEASSSINEFDQDELIEKNKKKQEYIDYINEHISNVKKAFEMFFVPLLDKENISDKFSDEEFKNAIVICQKENIPYHDASKFEDEEFEPYRLNFHATNAEKNLGEDYQKWVSEIFEEAWRHHYLNNSHHPLYWKNSETNEIADMSLEAIIEMICDWEAMSMKFKSDTIEWYNKAEEKSQMTENTKEIVEEILFNIIR